jgi:hypothetical protein
MTRAVWSGAGEALDNVGFVFFNDPDGNGAADLQPLLIPCAARHRMTAIP